MYCGVGAMSRAMATVRVRVVVEVAVGGVWGADCAIGQARAQGTQGALDTVQRIIQEHGRGVIRVVGAEADVMTLEHKP